MNKINQGKMWIAIVVIIVLLLGGWWLFGKLGQNAGEKAVEGAIERADEGTVTTENRLPANWPSDVPAYPGAKIELSGSSNQAENSGQGMGAIFITSDSTQKAVDFFKQELQGQGWTVDSVAEVSGTQILTAKKDNREFGLSAMTIGDQTRITVAITTK